MINHSADKLFDLAAELDDALDFPAPTAEENLIFAASEKLRVDFKSQHVLYISASDVPIEEGNEKFKNELSAILKEKTTNLISITSDEDGYYAAFLGDRCTSESVLKFKRGHQGLFIAGHKLVISFFPSQRLKDQQVDRAEANNKKVREVKLGGAGCGAVGKDTEGMLHKLKRPGVENTSAAKKKAKANSNPKPKPTPAKKQGEPKNKQSM